MEKSCYNQPMLSRDFQKLIETDTVAAARALLGMQLILNGQKLGRIVETEAYLGSQDSACHSAGGRHSPRNESMYLPAGHWYVYQIYGHQMLNLVTKAENVAEAVLIRALETSSLQLAHELTPNQIASRPRIGVTCTDAWREEPLGFYVAGNRHVSKVPKRGLLDDEDTWKKE